MQLSEIKKLNDKTPVQSVRGVIEKQYSPSDPTDKDIEFGQHKQSLLIADEHGEKLMICLMKSPLHILDPVEGCEIKLTAGERSDGELRGLVLNKWRPSNSQYDKHILKVYPDATIRILPPEGAEETTKAAIAGAKSDGDSSNSGSSYDPAETEFGKELKLTAFAYCLCLDKAQEMVEDRKLLKQDPESVRAIATNLWMSSKHKVATLAPWLKGGTTPPKPAPAATPPASKPKNTASDLSGEKNEVIIARVLKGCKLQSGAGGLKTHAKAALNELIGIMKARDLWCEAYDTLRDQFIDEVSLNEKEEENVGKVLDEVYDEMNCPDECSSIEEAIVRNQIQWADAVLAKIKALGGSE